MPSSHLTAEQIKRRFGQLQESLPVALARRFVEIDLPTQAAALSFYTLISLAPLLVLVLWLTASLYPDAKQTLMEQIAQIAGRDAEAIAGTVIANASAQPDIGSLAGIWSTSLLFLGATVVFARLQATLNLIFHTDSEQLGGILAWIRKRVFSFGVVFALGFLLLISAALTTVLEVLFVQSPSLPVLGNLGSLLVYSLAFALLYHYLPDRRVRWRQAILGGAVTALLFVAGRWGIGLYITHAAPGNAYGSMGTLVILLVWMYYAAMVFFAGALVTAVIDERAHQRGEPRAVQTPADPPAASPPQAPPR